MLLLAIMLMLLFPNYIAINNLNWLMCVLVMNSFSMQIASFHLHNKVHGASVYGGRNDSLGLTILLIVRMFILFCIVIWTVYKKGGLSCNPESSPNANFQYPV
jgi:hypothetical protein